MENGINNKKNSSYNFRILLFGIGVFVIIIGLGFGFLKYRYYQGQKKVQVFLHHVIDSVRNDTDFYKEHAAKSALRDYEGLKKNADKMTGPNDIIIVDYDWGMYECKITFADKTIFYAEVSFIDSSPVLFSFRLE
jgi:hypothetical protein